MTPSLLHVISGQLTGDAPLDTAVSRAILKQVSDGSLPETLQVGRPGRAVAFGKQDVLTPGFDRATQVALDCGYTPTIRIAGGHAIVFHEHTIRFTWTVPSQDPVKHMHRRFGVVAQHVVDTLESLGADAVIGELPGEYCPGRYSVYVAGSANTPKKVMGSGQRLARKASQLAGVIVVRDADAVNRVLRPVYAALGLDMDPSVTGCIADVVEVDTDAVASRLACQIADGRGVVQVEIEPTTETIARRLRNDHDPCAFA
ncbi:MAG: hypothetical protein QGM48_09465 [Actinomycetota bacterium]|nr:hypothetical protein [Actinomycetota bacterium]